MPLKGTLTGSYGTGIMLDGAHYTNPVTVTGTISLASVGIGLQAVTVWSIFNQGNILGPNSASAYGISLAAGGDISNASGGLINANSGINIASNAGTVVNGGSISGNSGAAISLTGGGIVTNQAGAVVTDVTGAGLRNRCPARKSFRFNRKHRNPVGIGHYCAGGCQQCNDRHDRCGRPFRHRFWCVRRNINPALALSSLISALWHSTAAQAGLSPAAKPDGPAQ